MKKNLLILLSFYFFVLQSFLVWLLRKDNNFFILWIINTVIIILIVIIYNYFEKDKKEKNNQETSFKKEKENFFIETHNKKSKKWFPLFLLIAIIVLAAFLLLKENLVSNKIIISSWIGFLTYIILFYSLSRHKKITFLGLRSSKIVLILFLFWFVINWFDYWINQTKDQTIISSIQKIFTKSNIEKVIKEPQTQQEEIQENNDTWTWEILSLNYSEELTWTYNITGNNTDIDTNTWNLINETKQNFLTDWNITILDAIKYLIDNNNISLDTKQNVKFRYVSYQNPNYPYFKTAYMKKMIWTSTNPDKEIICQTYIVMKWIAEWRNVSVWADPLTSYMKKADELWKLNWCERNKYVSLENL